MQPTQEHFDQQLTKWAAHLATSEEVQTLSEKIDRLQATVNSHTGVLDTIAKGDKDEETEVTMLHARLNRHDQWFKQIAEQLGLKLDN